MIKRRKLQKKLSLIWRVINSWSKYILKDLITLITIQNAQIQFNLAKCLNCYHAILFRSLEPSWLRINITLQDSHTHSQKTTQHCVQKVFLHATRPAIRKKCMCASFQVTNTGPNIQIFQPLLFCIWRTTKKHACCVSCNTHSKQLMKEI